MKKFVYPSMLAVILATACIIVSCDKDPNDPDSIQGTNKEQSTGTAANPNIGVVTVTGTSTLTNPATQNSALQVSGAGWSYDGCTNTSSLTGSPSLTGHNGSTSVNLTFGTAPPMGTSTWTLTSGNPGAGQARMTVNNAPSQPDGIVWYSKSGMVTVLTQTTSITPYTSTQATFSNIQCLQYTFLFPVVTVSGALICQ